MLHSLKAMRLAVLRAERLAGVRLLPLRRTFNRLLAGGPPLIVLDEEDGMTFDNPVEIDSEDEAPPAKKARTEKKKKKHKKHKHKKNKKAKQRAAPPDKSKYERDTPEVLLAPGMVVAFTPEAFVATHSVRGKHTHIGIVTSVSPYPSGDPWDAYMETAMGVDTNETITWGHPFTVVRDASGHLVKDPDSMYTTPMDCTVKKAGRIQVDSQLTKDLREIRDMVRASVS
jgi:hypothetical protein